MKLMTPILVILFTTLLITLSGCATLSKQLPSSGEPSKVSILIEAGTIALLFYETKSDVLPDDQTRGLKALEQADKYLAYMYGYSLITQNPKYTVAGLLHQGILINIDNIRLRKLAYTARLVLNPDGTLTGLSWADALLLGQDASLAETEN
jgi:hypothetical protein